MRKPSILGLLFLFFNALLIFHALRDHSKYTNYLKLIKSKEVLEEAIAKLEAKNNYLEKEIERIKNSKSYALKVLRERYHITEENEKIIFFTD